MILKKVTLDIAEIDINNNVARIAYSDNSISRQLTYALNDPALEFFMAYAEAESLYELHNAEVVLVLDSAYNIVGIGNQQKDKFILFSEIKFPIEKAPECGIDKILDNNDIKMSTISLVEPSIYGNTLGIKIQFKILDFDKPLEACLSMEHFAIDQMMESTHSEWAFQMAGKDIQVLLDSTKKVVGFVSASGEKILF